MSFLERIRPAKIAEVAALRKIFAANPAARPDNFPVRDFVAALRAGSGIIAEVKRTSPSRPDLRRLGPVEALAKAYRRGGACALSLVTDREHFGTSLDDVAYLRAAVDLPVLTKDFIIDPVQIRAAWAAGADAILLIVSMLDPATLADLLAEARSLGLAALVETHSADEIDTALAAEADLVGVNNRDLGSLTTDLAHGEALLPRIPDGVVTVTESGLDGRADVDRMAAAGADAFLIGHALLLDPDPGRKVAEMAGRLAVDARWVKVCGLTDPSDARQAHEAGADALGLIFADSPRQVDEAMVRRIRDEVPDARLCGVFMGQDPREVSRIARACDLDLVQLHGHESPADCALVSATSGLPVVKVLRPDEATAETVGAFDTAAYFLVDRPKGGDPEVTGEDLIAAAVRLREAGGKVLLAGGLDPANVAGAIAAAEPFGVDVASGVESEPGRKDHGAVSRFIREAKA